MSTIGHVPGRRAGPGSRAASWVALAAGAAAVAVLLALLAREPVALPVALAALIVAGASGWLALVHRGPARVLGIVGVVGALAGGAVALVLLDAVGELLALAAALFVFVAAARTALRSVHARPDARARTGSAVAVRHPVLLMNPKSGGGKVERFDLAGEARRRGIEPIVLRPGDDLVTLAREAAARADALGMAGGDGSQALVAEVALEHGLPYVCIPAGTRNHLALDLGLDRDDVVGALDAFAGGIERRIDVAYVNDRLFVNNVSLGIYAEIVQSEEYRDAKLRTMERRLPELLGPDAEPFDLRFAGPDGRGERSAQLLLVSNNRYVIDRLAALGSRPRLDAGELGVVAVEIDGPAQAAELVSLEALGQAHRFAGWTQWTAPTFEVCSSSSIAAGIDGEAILLDPPLRFRLAPGALTVLVPPAALGVSPAGLTPRLSVGLLGELVGIAAGSAPVAKPS